MHGASQHSILSATWIFFRSAEETIFALSVDTITSHVNTRRTPHVCVLGLFYWIALNCGIRQPMKKLGGRSRCCLVLTQVSKQMSSRKGGRTDTRVAWVLRLSDRLGQARAQEVTKDSLCMHMEDLSCML